MSEILLEGPDGGNPLGFLTAVGTFRIASLCWPDRNVRLSWTQHGMGWHPVLRASPLPDGEELVHTLHAACAAASANAAEDGLPQFAFSADLKLSAREFRTVALSAVEQAVAGERTFADFVASFGCDGCVDKDGVIEDTAFRTMSGAGHQHFLGTMLNLARVVTPAHIRSALLEPWSYVDPVASLSMRWDPADDRRYARQWQDPSTDPARSRSGSVLGANRLAVEALPLLPSMPQVDGLGRPHLATTGFERRGKRWVWPLWKDYEGVNPEHIDVDLDECRSLLAHPALQAVLRDPMAVEPRRELRAMGVVALFQSERIAAGYYRNFTPARVI